MYAENVATFRKLNPAIMQSAHLATQPRPEVTKKQLASTLKRVAPALGIEGTAYQVLDILLGIVRADQFQPSRRPVVAISNALLAEYTCRSTRTVARALKSLVEAGILAYRDSPTGRRYVGKGEAYGLDFSPACHNLEHFAEQADAYKRRLKADQIAKRTITRLSRSIADMVEAGGNSDYLKRLDVIRAESGLTDIERAEWIGGLYREAVAEFGASERSRMSCEGDTDVTHIQTTTPPDTGNSRDEWTGANAPDMGFSCSGAAAGSALEEEHGRENHGAQAPKVQVDGWQQVDLEEAIAERAETEQKPTDKAETGGGALDGVSIGLIASAASEIRSQIGAELSTWNDLFDIADTLRVLIGLSPDGYQSAVRRHGAYVAAASVAVVAEKALRDPAALASPGGYFRAMIDRAGAGKLALAPSLRGLLEKGALNG